MCRRLAPVAAGAAVAAAVAAGVGAAVAPLLHQQFGATEMDAVTRQNKPL